jgi:subtilisin-like proprotein convertase family protein
VRRSLGWACLLLAVALLFPVADGTAPANAKKHAKAENVTHTFSDDGQIGIPTDGVAAPYPALIQVGGFKKGKIRDVDVTLRGFSHEHPNDVDVLLVSPGGRNTLIMSDVGGKDQADNLTLTLDDQAAAELPKNTQLEDGAFRPSNYSPIDNLPPPAPVTGDTVALSVFNGGNPNGQWQLFIRDDRLEKGGEFAGGWSLRITARVEKHEKHRRHH